MKERTHQTTMNDESRPQAEALTDLPVTDEQAGRTTAGGTPAGRLYVATQTGVFV
jgi:hypothetical protein